jgi:hypothetical protein
MDQITPRRARPNTTRLARALLRASGLPSLDPIAVPPGGQSRASAAIDALLDHGDVAPGFSLTPLVRWLAQERGLLFHGSWRADLDVLNPIRESRDTTTFGNQKAVYATSDPVWAIYFATLDRTTDDFTSTRNGSIGLVGSLYPRWYFFSHNVEASSAGRFGTGWLYVLPPDGFEAEPPVLGLDSAQWASREAVTPLARIPVGPEAFPFADWVVSHNDDDRVLTTMLTAVRAGRRMRRSAMGEG